MYWADPLTPDNDTRTQSKAPFATRKRSMIAMRIGVRCLPPVSILTFADDSISPGVTAYSVHPGVIPSNLQSADPGFVGMMMRVGMKFRKTTALEGCHNSLYCATTSTAFQQGQGKYFTPVGKVDPKADHWLNDREGNAKLWQWSEAAMQRHS